VDGIQITDIGTPKCRADYSSSGNGDASISHSQKRHDTKQDIPDDLYRFVFIPTNKWESLSRLALDENWGGKELPLLKNYIRHTFTRLVHEEKVKVSEDNKIAVFNTGLVDDRYRTIYALLKPNAHDDAQDWYLDAFCIAGENGAGKALVSAFKKLPDSAYYLTNPADAIYDIYADTPIADWEHIVVENVVRLPVQLLEMVKYHNLKPDRKSFTTNKKGYEDALEVYKSDFKSHLDNTPEYHRLLITIFESALTQTLKKVRWNYKTAIPVYSPTRNTLSLLLPLSLLNDKVDLALLVEKTPSGNYQAHTAYPLDWAYKNSRLITRPDSDWLQVESLQEDSLDAENDSV
jgi:hypothetical protein